jgi:hypothetical protein
MQKIILTTTIFTIYLFFSRCNLNKGFDGMSESVQESQKRKVFVCKYRQLSTRDNFANGNSVEVKNAWLEKQWKYSENNRIVIFPAYQLIVHTKEELKRYSLDWTIGVDGDHYFRGCDKRCLITDFESLPSDTLTWQVQNTGRLDSSAIREIIGTFGVVRQP